MEFLAAAKIDTTPVKYGKLPKAGKVNMVIQFNKYDATDAVKEQLMDMGAATDGDIYRPLFALYDIDAKQARQIVVKNRQQLLCIMIADSNKWTSLYECAPTQTAWDFFMQWMSTNPTMYIKNVKEAA